MISALRSSRHSAGIAGRTTSSAASAMSKKSMPVLTPILSNTPISASTGALPAPAPKRRHAAVDLLGAGPDGLHRVGDAQAEVLVAVEADLGVVAELGDQRRDPVGHPLEHQRAGRVDDVDALAPGVGHDAGLRGQLLRRNGVGHHQKPDRLQAQLAGQAEVLDRHVGLGAVGGDPADRPAVVLRLLDVLLGADARQHQEGDLGLFGGLGGQLDQFLLGRLGEPVVEARPAQTVAVGHLDDRHAGGVQSGDDRTDLVLGELVTLVVRPVAQRRVGHPDVPDRVEEDRHGDSCLAHPRRRVAVQGFLRRSPRRPWWPPRS